MKKKRRDRIKTVAIVTLAAVTVMAILGQPADLWLTKNQQGDRLFAKGDFAAAAVMYTDPLRIGAAQFRDGQFKKAAASFARLDNADSALNRGNALVMLGKYDDAINSFDRALQFRPEWVEAQENRAVAVARRDRMKPPEDDAGGTGGQLEADEIVFDDRAKNSSQTEEIEVGAGQQLSDQELRQLWLQRVQTSPGDFLRAKFSYQLSRQKASETDSTETPQ